MVEQTVQIISNDLDSDLYYRLVARGTQIAPLVQPGQFAHLRILPMKEALLRRPFSIFQARGDTFSILYKIVGKGTSQLARMRPGEELSAIGPLGHGFTIPKPGAETPLLVAGGYGMAALYLLAERSPQKGIVFVGGRRKVDILCEREFRELGWDVRVATEDGSLGEKGLVTQPLVDELRRERKGRKIFACGPTPMLKAVAKIAGEFEVPAELSMDEHMCCGVGVCLTCVLPVKVNGTWEYQRACTEGPVFDSRNVLWEAPVVNLSVRIGKLKLQNPVMVASGTFGYGAEYSELIDLNQLGAVVVKGIRLEPVRGNPTPRTVEVSSGLINAIGLQGPGVNGFIEKYWPFLKTLQVPAIINIWGTTVDEYSEVARRFDALGGVGALELNVSCPNIKKGGAQFGTDLQLLAQAVSACRKATSLPLITKLSPNVVGIAAYARVAEESGSDALSIMNSYPAMAIDIETRRPKLANVTGGLTGPCIKPIAIKLVWEAANAVRIPIIGMGGIQNAADAIEFLIAGATAVAVGTANFYEPRTALQVIAGIAEYLKAHGIDDVGKLTGTVRISQA